MPVKFRLSRIASALACLLLARQESWAPVWSDLSALRSGSLAAEESSVTRARLERVAEEAAVGARRELLRLELDHLAGRDVRARAEVLATLSPSPFSPSELWFLVDAMPEGEPRARWVETALAGSQDLPRWQVLLAWNVGVDEARALRHGSALPIQRRLHERYPETWSTVDLALTYRQLGLAEELRALYEGALASGPTGELWCNYAIATLGSGDERRARDYLGRALALGSEDAGRVLGRLDLVQGRLPAARATFRAILQAPPMDWAWRGWGTTLLPDPFSPPATISSTTSHE
jgi:tetratricopeptide (TPR) repeat protein